MSEPGDKENSTTTNNQPELRGPAKILYENRGILGFINILAFLVLVYFALSGFWQGLVYLPFGFGMMGVYFLLAYLRNSLRVDFGKTGIFVNMVILIAALVCLIVGMTIENQR